MTKTSDPSLYEQRAKCFDLVIEHFEDADGPDCTVPGASKRSFADGTWIYYPRYVLIEQYGDHGRYFANLADTVDGIRNLAAEGVRNGSAPVCYMDLDELEVGDDLPPDITYQGEVWDVHGHEYSAGEKTGKWVLKKSPSDRRRNSYDWATVNPSKVDVGGWEDERLPRRYDVAGVVTTVVFNTIPTSS